MNEYEIAYKYLLSHLEEREAFVRAYTMDGGIAVPAVTFTSGGVKEECKQLPAVFASPIKAISAFKRELVEYIDGQGFEWYAVRREPELRTIRYYSDFDERYIVWYYVSARFAGK